MPLDEIPEHQYACSGESTPGEDSGATQSATEPAQLVTQPVAARPSTQHPHCKIFFVEITSY